jgi:hypothetical protein
MDKLLELQKEANKILKSNDNDNAVNAFRNIINFESMQLFY